MRKPGGAPWQSSTFTTCLGFRWLRVLISSQCLLGFLAHCLKDNVFKKTKPKKKEEEEEEEGEGKEEEEEEGGEKKEFSLGVFPRA